ncbi:hypothetical protein P253_01688 [Acinetobacter indicus CIP 110367]|uniref:Uncharacterized protein n=1 Tax=Acinetobacter indicus CIP 110367 TaxID=1341679 RepID=V2UHN6_9GAMM|nr:hypothetical protein F905_01804 [Acinetobacter sp. CIP 53.82]EPF72057.1 hypothetical protein F956_02009 [Acinetobacter indicus ANC 4215]ESK48160.1 hypothetical protein P253_01688 [Acinetobacter indicus CIP 110367]
MEKISLPVFKAFVGINRALGHGLLWKITFAQIEEKY